MTMPTQITAHFTLGELERASTAPLNSADIAKGTELIERILEPARTQFGWPIAISSFKRANDTGAHGAAEAIDFHPCCDDPALARGRMDVLFNWLRAHKRAEFGELGHERTHLHVTRRGYRGEIGETWTEPREGTYVIVDPQMPSAGDVAKGISAVALLGAALGIALASRG